MISKIRNLKIDHKVDRITWYEYRLELEDKVVAKYERKMVNISDDPIYKEWISEEKLCEVWGLDDVNTPEYVKNMF